VNILFQGDQLDVYIHWLVLLLGIGVLISGVAVFTSCRSFASLFHLIQPGNSLRARLYKAYYKYHSFYWVAFWYVLAMHLLVTITHVGLPNVSDPFFRAHQVVFFTALGNAFLVLVVLTSCRSFASILNFFINRSPLANRKFKRFYQFHSYFWWFLGISLCGHIVFGVIHAINT
jgi:hypothetical protein